MDNVAGVKIPVFDKVSSISIRKLYIKLFHMIVLILMNSQVESETKTQDLTGLARGGQKVPYRSYASSRDSREIVPYLVPLFYFGYMIATLDK